MKVLMFSGGVDSTYLAWKLLTEKSDPEGVHLHYVSIRNNCENIWKHEDVATKKIVEYFRKQKLKFEFSTSIFEFFGFPCPGFDSDLLLVVAQKVCMNVYGHKISVLLGWTPHDIQRPEIMDRSERHVSQNIWHSLVQSMANRDRVNDELSFPLIDWNITKDIMIKEMPKELLDLTWSCRFGVDSPCGHCHSCNERKSIGIQ